MMKSNVSIHVTEITSVFSKSSNLRTILIVLSVGVASHFMLFLDSVMDNLLPAAKPFLLTVYKNHEEADIAWEIMVSSRVHGLAFGCFLSILLSLRPDRRFPVILGCVLDLIGILLTLLTVYVRMGMVAATIGRFINGCGQGIVQTAGSVMMTELPPQKRGIALATLTVWACLGELGGMVFSLEDLLGRPATWHFAMCIPLFLLIPALFVLVAFPAPIRDLISLDEKEEAAGLIIPQEKVHVVHKSIIPRNPDKPTELEMSGVSFVKQRFKCGKFIRPLLLASFVQCFVHLDDWLWISYSTHIFGKYGMSMASAQRASLFMSIPQAVISIGLLVYFENFSRRSLLLVPTIFSAFVGMVGIITINFIKGSFGMSVGALLAILASIDLCAAAVSGESAYAIVPELFLPNDKILGTAIVGVCQNLFGGMLTACLLTAVNEAGTTFVLIPLITMNIFYVAINYIYLPETGKKTSYEVSEQFSKEMPGKALIETIQRFSIQIRRDIFKPTALFHAFAVIAQLGCMVLVLRGGIHLYWVVTAY